MIDLGPPPLLFPTPTIIRPVAGGLWGSLDAELMRLGLPRAVRRAVETELKRVLGTKEQREGVRDLSRWQQPLLASPLWHKLLRATSAKPASISFRTSANNGGSQTSHTFTAQDAGTAASDRHIIVFVMALDGSSGSRTISAVAINSNTASLFTGATATVSSGYLVGGFYYLLVTSGTTVDVAVTMSGSVATGIGIGVWAAYGLQSTTPVATNTQTSTSGTLSGVSASTSANGIGLGAIMSVSSGTPTFTPTNLTEDYNAGFGNVSFKAWGGSAATSGSSISLAGSSLGNRALSVLLALR